jgi:hypothetical protein
MTPTTIFCVGQANDVPSQPPLGATAKALFFTDLACDVLAQVVVLFQTVLPIRVESRAALSGLKQASQCRLKFKK